MTLAILKARVTHVILVIAALAVGGAAILAHVQGEAGSIAALFGTSASRVTTILGSIGTLFAFFADLPTALGLGAAKSSSGSSGGAAGATGGILILFASLGLIAFAIGCQGCHLLPPSSTPTAGDGGTVDAGPHSPLVQGAIDCTEAGCRAIALRIIPDVELALATQAWEPAVADLVARFGMAAVACAVAHVTATATVDARMARGDTLAPVRAARGRAWLAAHAVVFASDGGVLDGGGAR